jgi:hypothetical protein
MESFQKESDFNESFMKKFDAYFKKHIDISPDSQTERQNLNKGNMKTIISIIGVISSVFFGFIFAGFIGAFLFSLILTLSVYLVKKRGHKSFTGFTAIGYFFSCFILGYMLMNLGGLLGADPFVLKKLNLIELELKSKGFKTNWIVISQKRSRFFNSFLPNSAKGTKPGKQSFHLTGKAVDIYVFDINGDEIFDDEDIKLIEKANNTVESKHPELIGGFGDYFLKKHDYFTKHMIHIDIRGSRVRYTL